jgi:hypothetical protein
LSDVVTRGEWIQIILTVVLAAAAVLWALGRWRIREWFRQPTFSIDFPLHPSTELTDFPKTMTVTVGDAQTVYIRVWVNQPVLVDHCNVRFVKTKKGGNVPTEVIEIRQGYDAHLAGHTEATGVRQTRSIRDQRGGVDIEYFPSPKPVAAKQDFWLGVQFSAHRAWEGFLSFEGYDRGGHRRWRRAPFTVLPLIPDTEDSQTDS